MELKPCPLCASRDIHVDYTDEDGTAATCLDCDCHIRDWNSRPREERLEKALETIAEIADRPAVVKIAREALEDERG